MQKDLIKLLINLGLKDNQAKVYLALLELGEANVSEISQRAHLKRTSLYFILDDLKHLGAVNELKIGKKSAYKAINPNQLLELFKNKVSDLENNLGDLNSLYAQSGKSSHVTFYEYEEGFKQIWQKIFRSNIDEFLIITDPREMLAFAKERYITNRVIKEKVKRGIKSRQLLNVSEYAKKIVSKDKSENRVSKFLPSDYKISSTIIIFGDNVAFIAPYDENIIFLAESEGLAKTQRAVFNSLWEVAQTEI